MRYDFRGHRYTGQQITEAFITACHAVDWAAAPFDERVEFVGGIGRTVRKGVTAMPPGFVSGPPSNIQILTLHPVRPDRSYRYIRISIGKLSESMEQTVLAGFPAFDGLIKQILSALGTALP